MDSQHAIDRSYNNGATLSTVSSDHFTRRQVLHLCFAFSSESTSTFGPDPNPYIRSIGIFRPGNSRTKCGRKTESALRKRKSSKQEAKPAESVWHIPADIRNSYRKTHTTPHPVHPTMKERFLVQVSFESSSSRRRPENREGQQVATRVSIERREDPCQGRKDSAR